MKTFTKVQWISEVKRKLPKKEASLLIKIYEKYTCIHEDWVSKETEEKATLIRTVAQKALSLGLLHRSYSFSEGYFFPISSKQKRNRTKA